MDLEHQLRLNCKAIKKKYVSFVSCLCDCLEEKKVEVKRICTVISSSIESKDHLGIKVKLREADTIRGIIDIVGDECASYIHYDIFQTLLEKFCGDIDHEDLKYSEHLQTYINTLKLSELMKTIPELLNVETSKKLCIKVDTALCSKFTTIVKLQSFIAEVLEVMPAKLQLLKVEEGCVTVTFLVPACITVAGKFTKKRMENLRFFSILWLKCDDENVFIHAGENEGQH